jgi:pimeloyl-ACP methyl ester carboxylesterase
MAVFLLALLFIVVISLSSWCQHKALFHPIHDVVWGPPCQYDELFICAETGKTIVKNGRTRITRDDVKSHNHVHAWHIHNFKGAKTVIFCHGNVGNISHREYMYDICQRLKLNLFLFDYRGFGMSSGQPSKQGLRRDSEVAYEYLSSRVDPHDIIVWGESLGGYSACWMAAHYKCRSLILLATFSSLTDVVDHHIESIICKKAVGVIMSCIGDNLENKKLLKKVSCPIVIIHSTEDTLIPYECAVKMYNSITTGSKVLIPIKGDHANPDLREDDISKILMFCDVAVNKHIDRRAKEKLTNKIRTFADEHFLPKNN